MSANSLVVGFFDFASEDPPWNPYIAGREVLPWFPQSNAVVVPPDRVASCAECMKNTLGCPAVRNSRSQEACFRDMDSVNHYRTWPSSVHEGQLAYTIVYPPHIEPVLRSCSRSCGNLPQ